MYLLYVMVFPGIRLLEKKCIYSQPGSSVQPFQLRKGKDPNVQELGSAECLVIPHVLSFSSLCPLRQVWIFQFSKGYMKQHLCTL